MGKNIVKSIILTTFLQPAIVSASILTSILGLTSAGATANLQISIENLAPDNGILLTKSWFGFQDGSFDFFDRGTLANLSTELLAEDNIVGLEEQYIPGLLERLIQAGLDPSKLPPSRASLGEVFAASPAGLSGGTQGMIFGRNNSFIINPGETTSTTIKLSGSSLSNRYFSYATQIFPSNDAFIGNDDSKAIEIFDVNGKFIGADLIISGNQVLDAGTEVNDESPSSIPYSLAAFRSGIEENAAIQFHPGFKPPGSGGILDISAFANANFLAPEYQIARIRITQIPEGHSNWGILVAFTGLLKILTRKR